MFYSSDLLARRDSGFSLLWLAATLGSKSTLKRLTKKSVLNADISHLCDLIATPAEPLALRLSSNLMMGVARVYKLKYEIFVTDVTTVYSTLKKANELNAFGVHVVDPKSLQMKKGSIAMEKITLQDEGITLLDIDLGDFNMDWEFSRDPSDLPEIQPQNEFQMIPADRNRHTIDESHLHGSLSEEMFDPLDFFDFGGAAQENSESIDLGLDLGWDAPNERAPIETNYEMDMGTIDAPFDEPGGDILGEVIPVVMQPGHERPFEAIQKTPDRVSSSLGKRGREQERDSRADFDADAYVPHTPKSILRAPQASISPNLVLGLEEPNGIEDMPSPQANISAPSDAPNVPEDVKEANIGSKTRRPKKAVRILLDPHTELTDAELRRARDNYLREQSKMREEITKQRFQKAAAESARELILNPPVIIESEVLRQFWADSMLAHLDVKTGVITLLSASPQKRARKRRRVNRFESPIGMEVEMLDEGNLVMETEMGADMDGGFQNDQGDWMEQEDPRLPFNLSTGVVRSSEEPELPRRAPSQVPSIRSIEIPRDYVVEEGTQHSGLFPWDNAAPSSSNNEGIFGSIANSRSDRNISEHDIADTNIELRSLSGSRRGSFSLSQQGGPLVLPGDLPDNSIEDYRLPDPDEHVETQQSDVAPETLERNALNFLVFMRIQQNTKETSSVTLDDMVGPVRTLRVASSAFYCCLVLATKNLLRVKQDEAFGTITLELP
ncbi:hypothetical protein CPB86DRAFT_765649 [Serendipita vermifera]|nr:hypothetical protein CPB86DRAFT_765649 [Serendipita vermifera]